MPRPVTTAHSLLIHLFPDTGHKTVCGLSPVSKTPPTVHRCSMCSLCFGKDRGDGKWTAAQLGLDKIIEK